MYWFAEIVDLRAANHPGPGVAGVQRIVVW
jgi:hypothetical protein